MGGASGSQHRLSNAADFRAQLVDRRCLDVSTLAVWSEKWMDELRVRGGLGMYHADENNIHVDARGKNVTWYDSHRSGG